VPAPRARWRARRDPWGWPRPSGQRGPRVSLNLWVRSYLRGGTGPFPAAGRRGRLGEGRRPARLCGGAGLRGSGVEHGGVSWRAGVQHSGWRAGVCIAGVARSSGRRRCQLGQGVGTRDCAAGQGCVALACSAPSAAAFAGAPASHAAARRLAGVCWRAGGVCTSRLPRRRHRAGAQPASHAVAQRHGSLSASEGRDSGSEYQVKRTRTRTRTRARTHARTHARLPARPLARPPARTTE
jgi:hypothetical protein